MTDDNYKWLRRWGRRKLARGAWRGEKEEEERIKDGNKRRKSRKERNKWRKPREKAEERRKGREKEERRKRAVEEEGGIEGRKGS